MGFNPAEKTLNRAAGLKNVGKTTRRVFLRTLALATAAFGLARYRTSRGAAAAADTVGAGPFTWASLAQRGATITDALGRPDLAGRILSDCGLPGTCDGQAVVSSLTEDDLSLDRWNTFFEIFPSGQALARIAYLLSNISWISPRYAIDPLVAGGLYVTNSADQPLGISLLPVSSLPSTLPSWELLIDASVGPKVWAIDPDRVPAMVAAMTIVGLASLDALSQLEAMLSSTSDTATRVLARFQEITIGAVQRAMLVDLLGPSPLDPLIDLMASGYLPLGPTQSEFLILVPKNQ